MTTENVIIEELSKSGINVKGTGIDSVLSKMIAEALDDVKTFGFDYWEANTTAGPRIKKIILKLSNK